VPPLPELPELLEPFPPLLLAVPPLVEPPPVEPLLVDPLPVDPPLLVEPLPVEPLLVEPAPLPEPDPPFDPEELPVPPEDPPLEDTLQDPGLDVPQPPPAQTPARSRQPKAAASLARPLDRRSGIGRTFLVCLFIVSLAPVVATRFTQGINASRTENGSHRIVRKGRRRVVLKTSGPAVGRTRCG
jgi:hypothetical protein